MRIAAHHYETAETFLEGDSGSTQARGWLRFHRAITERYTDREGALAHLEEARRIAARVEDPILAAHSLAIHGMLRCWGDEFRAGLTEMTEATEIMGGASELAHAKAWRTVTALYGDAILDDPMVSLGHPLFRFVTLPGINMLAQFPPFWMAVVGRYQQAVELAEPYIAEVGAATDDEMTLHGLCRFAYGALANAYDMLGEPETARQWRSRELAAAQVFEDQANVTTAHILDLRDQLTYHTDRVAERRRASQAVLSAMQAMSESLGGQIRSELSIVQLNLLEGRWDRARDLVTSGWIPGLAAVLRTMSLGFLAREQGEPSMAWEQIGKLLPNGPHTEPGNSAYSSAVVIQRLAISLSLDAGDLERARLWLEAHDRWQHWSGAVIGRAEGAMLWARYFEMLGERQRALECAEQALADASNPRQPLALISAHRLLGELAALDKRIVEAGEHLNASLALAEACEAPYEQALSLLSLAELGALTGDADTAWQHLNQARAICSPLGAIPALQRATAISARLSVRRGQPAHPAGLTPREIEVLQLIARGMTNPEAGETLFISSRTVAQHLRSIYNKLGVDSRVEATRFAVEHGLVESPSV